MFEKNAVQYINKSNYQCGRMCTRYVSFDKYQVYSCKNRNQSELADML